MEKKAIIKQLFSKKSKDYTYTVIFFFVFSFFAFFVIRPNLVSVFSSNNLINKLKTTDNYYETQINKIIEIQSSLEKDRENIPLIRQALPRSPDINKILDDLNKVIEKNKLSIEKISLDSINLKEITKEQNLKSVDINTAVSGSFENLYNFINDLFNQRRLKSIKQISIDRISDSASESAELKIKIKIQSYYL